MSESPVAWVTGGSAGIGEAIARTLADAGYTVVISARNQALLDETAAAVGASGLVCDVTDRAAVNAACEEILGRHGRIDLLVNNAGHNSR